MALVSSFTSPPYGTQYSGYYRPPPSPPMDEPKCSLPSISNLLGLADAGSLASEAAFKSQHNSPRPYAIKAESRPSSRHRALPPTPPMSTDASFDLRRSPSSKPSSIPHAAPSHYYETTPPVEAHDAHRHRMAPSRPTVSTSAAQQLPAMSSAPSPASNYYPVQSLPPPPPPPQVPGLHYQRPLPQSFPPPPPSPLSVTPSGGYVWQHHHYLNPSNGIPFPPTQDRYICQTCNKAFSRPSSLRIHSHSHTGEKPFKCPHTGCGKAFSVRSNMKRHERGCHGFDVGKGPILLA
ncbi:uncharacterized protein TRIREDRAFT_4921 [Trichoderma reesei QM6a]|uniref:Predicted protein n=2 Tax=Hypocrea jecorina TaxID=51453 RepID=G0RPU3_HYPJQ|nr:uncharacterized protein TRIREDRAFT_4921 [Trichoderma reesei QM6a]EGR46914.1 predicted protein [Trichoderma reesei QM6a]ETS00542.1 hypothetical protein M419DRAFT_83396 [Trichoderma reesei RUT C-30]